MRPPSTRSVGRRPLVLVLLALARQAAALTFEGQIARFASRRELPNVRKQRLNIEEQLESAVHTEDYVLAAHLRDDLAELRQKDPVVMASALRDELSRHISGERYDDAARCRDRLLVLRRFLPQYQLAGLWKGNYPNHGEALVRLHYQGDTLLATKVTGDEHVPAGAVTFRADLTTPYHESTILETGSDELVGVRVEVVSISSEGSSQQKVERYRGEGQIAARGYSHAHYVPGQLFLMDENVIGFLWVALGTFVVFNRVGEEGEAPGGPDVTVVQGAP